MSGMNPGEKMNMVVIIMMVRTNRHIYIGSNSMMMGNQIMPQKQRKTE